MHLDKFTPLTYRLNNDQVEPINPTQEEVPDVNLETLTQTDQVVNSDTHEAPMLS